MSAEIKLNPVGRVEAKQGRFYVVIEERFREALKELEGFGHIIIIWWGSQSDSPEEREVVVAEKPYRKSPDTIGIFATRSEIRPNPVLISTAAVLSIDLKKGIIEVPWIDAEPGTPVIDIKPYHPSSDRVKNVRIPDWCSDWPQWYEDSSAFDWAAVFSPSHPG